MPFYKYLFYKRVMRIFRNLEAILETILKMHNEETWGFYFPLNSLNKITLPALSKALKLVHKKEEKYLWHHLGK